MCLCNDILFGERRSKVNSVRSSTPLLVVSIVFAHIARKALKNQDDILGLVNRTNIESIYLLVEVPIFRRLDFPIVEVIGTSSVVSAVVSASEYMECSSSNSSA